ncbi:DUF2889 domain-containing protein [Paraburkholderia sp. GAS334]|uniref:DUF2889 domain-containing protein n=1 Tax=Paraburkholderia sp. GAS334 TaxID=3035131 RepID=UPI003D19EBDD
MEGEVRDITPDGTDLLFKTVPGGAAIHDIRVVMTLDRGLVVQSVTARMLETPTRYCPEIERAYSALTGLQVGPGWRQQVKAHVGGVRGCTHVTELILGPMATTAMQARFAIQRAQPEWRERFDGDAPLPRPAMLDTCHSYRSDGDAAKIFWPEHRRPEIQPSSRLSADVRHGPDSGKEGS